MVKYPASRPPRRRDILWQGLKLFWDKGCFDRAAAISFYAFFSLIPLMLIVTAALGFVMGTWTGLLDRVIGMTKQSFPYLSDLIIEDLRDLSRTWKTFGWVGAISLISSADLVLSASADALSAIFDTEKRFGYFRKKIINLLALLLGICAALLSVAITAASIISKKLKTGLHGLDFTYYIIQSVTFKFVLPFLLISVIVAISFRVFAGPHLNFRYAFYGSVLFAALWEAAKQLFTWYISNFGSYNKLYGSLGTLMVLLIWIFYSANIFLLSASMAKAAYAARTGKNGT